MELVKSGTYWNYKYNLYKVWDLYYFQIQDPSSWKTAWWKWNDITSAVKDGTLKLKQMLSTTTSNVQTTPTQTTQVNEPSYNTSVPTQTNVNWIYFGDDLERRFNYNYDRNFYNYIEDRNRKIANELLKEYLQAVKDWQYRSPQELITLRDKILTNILQKYWATPDWNSSWWQHTIDDIYRQAVLQLRQQWINSWDDLYKKIQWQADHTQTQQSNNEPVQQYSEQTQQDVVNSNEQSKQAVINKLEWLKDKLKAMWYSNYANAVDQMIWKVQAANNLKADVLANYDKYVDTVQKQLEDLTNKYWAEKDYLQNFLNDRFGELQAKITDLTWLTDELYQDQLNVINAKKTQQKNIAEWLAKKWQGSYAQAYVTNKQIDQDYLERLEKAKQDYLRNKNTYDYNNLKNLYSDWFNKNKSISEDYMRRLYDTQFNTQKSLAWWIQSNYEQYTNKAFDTSANAFDAAAQYAASVQPKWQWNWQWKRQQL